jgi:hypothetical protein
MVVVYFPEGKLQKVSIIVFKAIYFAHFAAGSSYELTTSAARIKNKILNFQLDMTKLQCQLEMERAANLENLDRFALGMAFAFIHLHAKLFCNGSVCSAYNISGQHLVQIMIKQKSFPLSGT